MTAISAFLAPWLWAFFTFLASISQVARNAMQRELIAEMGPWRAAYVRFLYGFPFALLFLAVAAGAHGGRIATPDLAACGWTLAGAVAQICATALMLAAMRAKSFVVATAYTKTEPVQAALFGLAFLGERIHLALAAGIILSTLGVALASWPARQRKDERGGSLRPAIEGLSAAALFALSAVGYRAAIVATGANYLAATTILTLALFLQSLLILVGLLAFDRAGLRVILRMWRPSLFAGFVGALGSQFWFIAFALQSAARVRTLALIEILLAQAVGRKLFRQSMRPREWAGVIFLMAGVALTLLA